MERTTFNKQTRRRGADPAFPRLLGERLCLDYVNTIDGPFSEHPEDFLTDYLSLLHWEAHVEILSSEQVAHLEALAAQQPEDAQAIFTDAIALRDRLYRLFQAVAEKRELETSDLNALKDTYLQTMKYADLAPVEGIYIWAWNPNNDALEGVLWPIAQSAVELLTSEEIHRVKQCPGCDDCGWLFLDTSKNGTRQWCSMEGCGSRAKMRRQYARKKREA